MADAPMLVISFKDLDPDEELRQHVERRCLALAEEFPEITRLEATIGPDGVGHEVRLRVTGRGTEADTHGTAVEVRQAADRALERVERQLRRVHDKRIFSRRREAQKSNPKRRT